MKKGLKYILITGCIIIGLIITSILLDTLNAYIFHKSPIISKYEMLDDFNHVDKGILFDIYHCHHSADVIFVNWVFKPFKHTCPPIKNKYMISVMDNVFVKSYTIESIEPSEEENYQYWKVSQFDGERKETIKVPILTWKIEENKKYEVMFRVTSEEIEENIKSIFENTIIINIKETDKDIDQYIR